MTIPSPSDLKIPGPSDVSIPGQLDVRIPCLSDVKIPGPKYVWAYCHSEKIKLEQEPTLVACATFFVYAYFVYVSCINRTFAVGKHQHASSMPAYAQAYLIHSWGW